MRIVLVDLEGGDGFISKDSVAGSYGSRRRPFSKVTQATAGATPGVSVPDELSRRHDTRGPLHAAVRDSLAC